MVKVERPSRTGVKDIAGCGVVEVFHCFFDFCLYCAVFCFKVEGAVLKDYIISFVDVGQQHLRRDLAAVAHPLCSQRQFAVSEIVAQLDSGQLPEFSGKVVFRVSELLRKGAERQRLDVFTPDTGVDFVYDELDIMPPFVVHFLPSGLFRVIIARTITFWLDTACAHAQTAVYNLHIT